MSKKPIAKRAITKSSATIRYPSRACGPIDAHFGEKLRARRRMMNPKMSQSDLGQRLDITFQQVQKYENGTNRISAATLVEIASHLKIDIGYFFDELPSKLPKKQNGLAIKTPALTELALAAHGPKLIKSFLNLKTDRMREAIADLARVLVR
jgi:transcriptional regulator with XRE-family HTH domain